MNLTTSDLPPWIRDSQALLSLALSMLEGAEGTENQEGMQLIQTELCSNRPTPLSPWDILSQAYHHHLRKIGEACLLSRGSIMVSYGKRISTLSGIVEQYEGKLPPLEKLLEERAWKIQYYPPKLLLPHPLYPSLQGWEITSEIKVVPR